MRYVAAYLLVALGGRDKPTAADIEKVLSSVGIESDKDRVKKVLDELSGKNLENIIAEGSKKLSSMPSGGGAVVASAGAAAAAPAAGGGAAKEEKKEEAKKEESEESDDDMGFGLFD